LYLTERESSSFEREGGQDGSMGESTYVDGSNCSSMTVVPATVCCLYVQVGKKALWWMKLPNFFMYLVCEMEWVREPGNSKGGS
jgi:hypothetical protein